MDALGCYFTNRCAAPCTLTETPRRYSGPTAVVQRSAASLMRPAHLDPVPLTLAGAPTLLR
eukprot:4172996-Prymnesium_polylepis.1